MTNLRICKLLTFVRYFAEALFYPFLSLFLSSKGINVSQIGIIIAAIPITSIVIAPIYSRLCRKPSHIKLSLLVMSFIEACLVFSLTFVSSFWPALVLVVGISIFASSNYGLIDSLLTLIAKEEGKTFSSVRIFGSTSYMLGVLLAGFISKGSSYEVLFYIACGLFVLVSGIYFFIRVPEKEEEKKEKTGNLFQNKAYVGYLIFYVLLIGSMQVGDDFYSLYLVSYGVEDYIYSYVMFAFILVEIIMMFILTKFGKRLGMKLFFISAILLVIRFFIQGFLNVPLWLLIGSQILRGVIWSIALYLSSTFITDLLGYKNGTSGIIYVLLGVQLFNSIFKLSGGYMIEAIGYSNFYLVLFGIAVIALIYFCFYYKACKKRNIL